MSRNTDSHFGNIALKNIRRSKFKMPCSHKTTFNTGDIIPIYRQEVLPGDTCKMNTASLVRMLTPINPTMDNSWMDIYYFFVPRRLVWEHWKEFMGENTTDAWTQEVEYTIPKLKAPEGGWQKGSIASYLGARINTENIWIDACYTRAYALIVREWFRNENISEPPEVSLGDADTTGSNGTDYVVDLQKGGMPAKAVKYADYFTRSLPSPQKGPDVFLPLGVSAPVITGDDFTDKTGRTMHMAYANGLGPAAGTRYELGMSGNGTSVYVGAPAGDEYGGVHPVNLYADLTEANATTISQLRQAFAIQRLYELDARGGTRYIELLKAHFGVQSSDARLQRPEYLGGKRIPINITQVIQQSATNDTSPQGTTAAYSLTIDNHDMFTKSFEEHGILMGLAVVRTEHTYQQGIDRILTRESRLDFYWPELANLSEMYIKNKEIYAQGTSEDEEAFGYQEAWADYRYMNNRITGELNSDYTLSLDSWTYADDYSQLPTLSDEWIKETDANVARTLAIQEQDQFIADFYFNQTWIRPLPIYSIPSLVGWY